MTGAVTVREVVPGDAPAIDALAHELAEYEGEAATCELTPETVTSVLFGPAPAAFCHIAELDGEVVGFALWFLNFSTWTGAHGIYLEDLFVRPEHRGSGAGRALMGRLAEICGERGYARLEWSVLRWNESSIGFYRSLGAREMSEWATFRLSGPTLRQVADRGRA